MGSKSQTQLSDIHFTSLNFILKKVKFRVVIKIIHLDFPGGPGVKNPPANAGDMSSIPGLVRSHMP